MRYFVILTCLLASVGIVWALCPFNSTADGALTIISILATLIVGISVVNSLEVAALKDKVSDIEKIKKDSYKTSKKTSILFHITNGNIYFKDKPLIAMGYYLSALILALKINEPDYAEESLQRAENAYARFMKTKQNTFLSQNEITAKFNDIVNLKRKPGYRPFKKRINQLIDNFHRSTTAS